MIPVIARANGDVEHSTAAAKLFRFWNDHELAPKRPGGNEVDAGRAPELVAILNELSQRAAIPIPRLYVIDSPRANAPAAGRDPRHVSSCVTVEFVVAWSGIALAWRGGIAGVWTAQLGFAFLLALIMAAEPATLAELFRSEFRLSDYSVSFNLGIGLAGATAPMVATALIVATGNGMAPAWYLMLGSAVAAGAAFLMADRSGQPLR